MAKYTINHTCGHQSTKNIMGTNRNGERDRRIEWYASQACPACEKAAADAVAEKLNLPPLIGSDKQCVWANQIRVEVLENLDKTIAWLDENESGIPPEIYIKAKAIVADWRDKWATNESASWAIDNRNFDADRNTVLRKAGMRI